MYTSFGVAGGLLLVKITGWEYLDPIAAIGRSFLEYLPNLFFLAVLALFTRIVIRLLDALSSGIERGAVSFPGFYPDRGAA